MSSFNIQRGSLQMKAVSPPPPPPLCEAGSLPVVLHFLRCPLLSFKELFIRVMVALGGLRLFLLEQLNDVRSLSVFHCFSLWKLVSRGEIVISITDVLSELWWMVLRRSCLGSLWNFYSKSQFSRSNVQKICHKTNITNMYRHL